MNGSEALEKVQNFYQKEKQYFDLIFMDVNMPIMDGFEAIDKIRTFYREMNCNEDKTIISMLTAFTD